MRLSNRRSTNITKDGTDDETEYKKKLDLYRYYEAERAPPRKASEDLDRAHMADVIKRHVSKKQNKENVRARKSGV